MKLLQLQTKVMPAPTPRDEVIPGQVYLYRMNHRVDGASVERYVFAARDRHVFKDLGEVVLIDLEDGQVWQCESGNLYLANTQFFVGGVS